MTPPQGTVASGTSLSASITSPQGAASPSSASPLPIVQGHAPEGAGSVGNVGARATGPLLLKPLDVSTAVGQECRLDLTALRLEQVTETSVTVTFDPKMVEFRRVTPGAVALASRTAEGQVMLTLRRDGMVPPGEGLLAMLFFQAKAPGQFPVDLQILPGKAAAPGTEAVGTSRAIIHAR